MERLQDAPFYDIICEQQINTFISVFLHEWEDIGDGFSRITNLERKMQELQDKGEMNEEVESALLHAMNILPHERKTYGILFELLTQLLDMSYENGGLRIYFADYYNDRFYQDIYSLHYSTKHFSIPSTCSRFFIFDLGYLKKLSEEKRNFRLAFAGSLVRRPIPGKEIGRTLIDPSFLFAPGRHDKLQCNIWRNRYKVTMFGIPLTVSAFPYTMQDTEVATCAETTIQNIVDYFANRYPEYKTVFPSQILQIAQRYSNTRNIPSRGLTYENVSKVFMELGFSPKLRSASNLKNRFGEVLHTYVASGFPVALGIDEVEGNRKGHSVIVIGTQYRLIDASENQRIEEFAKSPILRIPNKKMRTTQYQTLKGALENSYIVMDDGRAPYSRVKIYERDGNVYLKYQEEEKEWQVSIFAVPMSSEMLMDAQMAINIFRSILKNRHFGYSYYVEDIQIKSTSELEEEREKEEKKVRDYLRAGLCEESPLLTRIFLCTSKRLKEQRILEFAKEGRFDLMKEYQLVHFPRYVWCCELYTKESYSGPEAECVGEIVLDATNVAIPGEELATVIWLMYPWIHAYRKPNEGVELFKSRMYAKVQNDGKSQQHNSIGIKPFRFE